MTPSTRTPHVHQLPVKPAERNAAPRFATALLALAALATSGCGGSKEPAEAPASGEPAGALSEQIGAPRDTQFTAEIEARRGHVRVVVQEESTCDVIPVKSFIENGKKRQVAGDPTRSQPCNLRPARNVVVSLEVDGNTYRLGEPSSGGEVEADLNDEILRGLHGDDLSKTPVAKVMLRHPNGQSQQLGAVELVQLAQSERRLEELLAEFRKVLDRPQQKLSGAELARAYELYEQLTRWAGTDPRIGGLQALFLERLYDRKAEEATARFKNNLEALNAAKDILMSNRTTIVLPPFVSGAINGGSMNPQAVDWARGQVAIALRRYPTLCGPDASQGFTWSRLELSPPPATSRLAFEILRFAYDNPYESEIASLCQRVLG